MKFEEEIRKSQEDQFNHLNSMIEGLDIEKARSGTYADTPENRKKGRVGQKYGGKKEETKGGDKKESEGQEESSTPLRGSLVGDVSDKLFKDLSTKFDMVKTYNAPTQKDSVFLIHKEKNTNPILENLKQKYGIDAKQVSESENPYGTHKAIRLSKEDMITK